ncbi:MAG: GntR family transcriptional regulator [Kangiellaceae bacterium]|nr:GntR family transcriptional regulator [Kangiellaceae bacterium]
MVNFGQFNFLKIARKTGRGTFLAAGNLGELFLPKGQTPSFCEAGDKIEVFVYRNSDDEAVATTKKPRASVGEVACLQVVSCNSVGAFLDWGLPKDLFAPFGQQSTPMKEGERHIVAVYQDNTGRIAASSKLNRYVKAETKGFKIAQKVKAMVGDKTDLGFKLVVNSKYWGVLHSSDIFQPLKYGQTLTAYVKKVRPDGRIDMTLSAPEGEGEASSLRSKIMKLLQENNGSYPANDKTSPEIIYKTFGVSKKVFKSTIGKMYKNKQITIEKGGIQLVSK